MTPAIELTGISKSFAGIRVLKDVPFDVRPGEVHALLGENGAGKSTLIKIMAGLYHADSGDIAIDGRPVTFASPREAHAAGIATVHQELLLFPELTVAENIFLGQAPKTSWGGLDWSRMRKRARQLLDSLDSPRSRCRREGRHAFGRQPPARRDCPGPVAGRPRRHHGRADGGARRSRRATPHGYRAQAEGARRRHRLCQPPHAGDLRARRPRDGAARRQPCRHQGHRRGRRNRAGLDDGRPRHRPALSQEAGQERRDAARTARRIATSPSCATSPLRCGAARSSASPVSWDRAAPNWRSPFSASRRQPAAKSCSTASRSRSPARRRRAISASPMSRRTAACRD